jgi:hypothetical protein
VRQIDEPVACINDEGSDLFILLIVILIYNKERVQQVWRLLLNFYLSNDNSFIKKISIKTIATAIIIMVMIFAIDQLLVNFFGHGKG